MPGSGAGINRVGQRGAETLLDNVTSANTPVTLFQPPVGPAYGVLGSNDSGICMAEGIAFSKWVYQIEQVGSTAATGYSFALYGTISKGAYTAFSNQRVGLKTLTTGTVDVQPVNWFLLSAPSEQSGGGQVANPLTALGQYLIVSAPLVAVRGVLVASSSATGTVRLVGFAVP